MLGRGAGPVAKDVLPVVLEVAFVFPGRAEESGPMGFVHDREDTSPAANELMPRDLVDLKAFRRWRDVVEGDVEGRGLGGERVEDVLGKVGRKMLGYVVNVVGVPARFAADNGDARFGVASRHVGREVEVQELVLEGPSIWDG